MNLKAGDLLVLAVVTCLSLSKAASAEVLDERFALGLHLNSHSYSEGVKRFVYREARLDAARREYQRSPAAALRLIGLPGLDAPELFETRELFLAKYNTEAKFLNEVDRTVDQELDGLRFKDTNLNAVLRLSGAAVIGALPLPGAIPLGIVFDRFMARDESSFSTNPAALPPTEGMIFSEIANQTVDYIKSGSVLSGLLTEALKKDLGISNLEELKKSDSVKTHIMAGSLEEMDRRVQDLRDQVDKQTNQSRDSFNRLESMIGPKLKNLASAQKRIVSQLSDVKTTLTERTNQEAGAAKTTAKIAADQAAKREAEALQASEEVEQIRFYFGSLYFLGRVAKLPAREMNYIASAERFTMTTYQLSKLKSNQVYALANGYLAIAQTFVSLISQGGTDPTQVLLEAMKSLATQIDQLRDLMVARFDHLDSTIASGFSHQERLLDAVLRYEKGQTAELAHLHAMINGISSNLEKLIKVGFERESLQLSLACKNVNREESARLRDCALQAYATAAKFSQDEASVMPSLAHVDAGSGQRQLGRQFYESIPAFASVRFPGQKFANPEVWATGATMLARLFEFSPATMELNYQSPGDWQDVIDLGLNIQRAYREMFMVREDQDRYRVNASTVLGQLDRYASAVENYVGSFDESMRKIQFPFVSSLQPLPEEIGGAFADDTWRRRYDQLARKLSLAGPNRFKNMKPDLEKKLGAAEWGADPEDYKLKSPEMPVIRSYAAPATSAFEARERITNELEQAARAERERLADYPPPVAPVQQTESDRRPSMMSPERRPFDAAQAAKTYAFLRDPVAHCSNFTYKTDNAPVPDTWTSDRLLGQLRMGNLRLLDPSILPLLPREALWLNRLDEGRNKIEFCVGSITRTTAKPDTSKGNTWAFDYDLKINVSMTTSVGTLSLGQLTMNYNVQYVRGMAVMSYTGPMAFSPIAMWDGLNFGGNKLGPVRGYMDRYFRMTPTFLPPKVHNQLQALIDQYRAKAQEELRQDLGIGKPKVAREDLYREYNSLLLLRAINYTQVPEVAAMLKVIDDLPKPDDLERSMIAWERPDKVMSAANQAFAAARAAVQANDGHVYTGEIKTPVDETLGELQALRVLQTMRRDGRRP